MDEEKSNVEKRKDRDEYPTRSVIFVEYTKGAKLLKQVREVLERLEPIIGCKIKAVERAGTPVGRLFPLTQLWEGRPCERSDCVPCNQPGEEVYPCNKRNITYLSICLRCNPGGRTKKMVLEENNPVPSVYLGESGRSLHERAKEHWSKFKEKDEKSHI